MATINGSDNVNDILTGTTGNDFVHTRSRNDAEGQMQFSDFPMDTRQRTWSFQVNIPLFAGGGVQSRVREAAALRDRARDELAAARLESTLKVRQAYLGVVNGAEKARALETSLESNRLAVESNRIGVRVGTRTTADLLNAQQQLYVARRDYAQARNTYFINRIRLAAETGTLDFDALAAVNASLGP